MKTDDTFGKKLAVLMTCHNRREKTLRCLTSLFSCRPEAGLELSVYLVDDGSPTVPETPCGRPTPPYP